MIKIQIISTKIFNIFLKLIIDPDTFFNEKDLISQEVCGAAFVKSRNILNFSKINPRINLPFLYSYCCSNYGAKQQELCDLNTHSLQIFSKSIYIHFFTIYIIKIHHYKKRIFLFVISYKIQTKVTSNRYIMGSKFACRVGIYIEK